MSKCLGFIGVIPCLFIGSCSDALDIEVDTVTFIHPDEIVKGEGVIVLADRRIFALMAFMNATGYDEELEKQMHPVRVKVREMLKNNLAKTPEKFRVWQEYYKEKNLESYHYLDFALSLNSDYPFRRIRPSSESVYPFAASKLSDFPDVLNDFWTTADLEKVWNEVKPDYVEELKKYDFEKMKRQLSFLWEYLRMERRDTYVLVNIPNLLDSYYQAIGAHYENYYYSVEGPGATSYALNIHEYLHSIVNPIVEANYNRYTQKLEEYYQAGKDQPLARHYQQPVTFAFECLVRALDRRVQVKMADDPAVKKILEDGAAHETKTGLTLTQPFYLLLSEYEMSDKNFEEFVPTMLERLPKYGKYETHEDTNQTEGR